MATNTHQTISKDAMIASFLAKIPPIEGAVALKELLRVFTHLIACAQSTVTVYNMYNFLFLVVQGTIWNISQHFIWDPTPFQKRGHLRYDPKLRNKLTATSTVL